MQRWRAMRCARVMSWSVIIRREANTCCCVLRLVVLSCEVMCFAVIGCTFVAVFVLLLVGRSLWIVCMFVSCWSELCRFVPSCVEPSCRSSVEIWLPDLRCADFYDTRLQECLMYTRTYDMCTAAFTESSLLQNETIAMLLSTMFYLECFISTSSPSLWLLYKKVSITMT